MEVFLKRSEFPFKDKIGAQKTQAIFDDLKKELYLIPGEFSSLGLEIPKILFKYSEGLGDIPSESVEGILYHFLLFTKSLNDLANQELKQVNQKIIIRSKSEMRNLSDVCNAFVSKARDGELMKETGNFEDILTFIIGESVKIVEFDNLELFVKRSIDNFAQKLGDGKANEFSNEIFKALNNTQQNLKGTIDNEIVRYIFKFSQDIKYLTPTTIENIINQVLMFTQSLSDIGGKNKNQIDQEIVKRSTNKVKSLFELLMAFLEKAKDDKLLESFQSFEDVISHVLGTEKIHKKYTDVGGFLKRVENKYSLYLGEVRAQALIDDILKALSEIPEEHGAYIASDISRFLTKYSETMNTLEIKDIENILNRSLLYTRSLKELTDLNREETNQFIINRSKHKIRNLFELYKAFLIKVNPVSIKSRTPSFDDVVIFTLGKYEGPKAIDEASSIHDLMADHVKKFTIAEEHSKWANAMNTIIPRYMEILENEEGEKLLDQLWNFKLPPNQIVENYKEKIAELPRENEGTFMFRLMNLLTRPVLKKKKQDRALTGNVAFIILGKIFAEIYSGRNTMIRGIKVNKLLKDRNFAIGEKREDIDEAISLIVKEDLDAIKKRSMVIRSIIPVLTLKGYYIKAYDINTKLYPELFVDVFSGVDPLSNIGKKQLKTQKRLNTLGNINALYYYFDLLKRFSKDYFKEAYKVPLDAVKKRKQMVEFFGELFDLYENLEVSKFYDNYISTADRLIFISIMKYLYESLQKIFDLLEDFLEKHKDHVKIKSMDYYLSKSKLREAKMNIEVLQNDIQDAVSADFSEDSEKMMRLKNMLEQQKSDIFKYRFMDDMLEESIKARSVIDSRILFSRELLTFLGMVREINPNLPAPFSQYLGNIADFEKEINKTMEKIKKVFTKKLISNADFHEKNQAAIISKKRLSELVENNIFMEHIKRFLEARQNVVLFDDTIEKEELEEELVEVEEEINPLEEFFEKYKDELMAVQSTNSLDNFTEAFNFWMKEEILPITKNKAEEMLLKNIFRKIKKKVLPDNDLPSS